MATTGFGSDHSGLNVVLSRRAAVLERMPVIEKTSGQSNGVSSGDSVKDSQPVKVKPGESLLPQPPANQVE